MLFRCNSFQFRWSRGGGSANLGALRAGTPPAPCTTNQAPIVQPRELNAQHGRSGPSSSVMPGTTVSSRRSSRRTLRRSIHRPSRHARSPSTTLGASQSRGAHVVVLLGNCDALRVFLTVPGRSVTMSVIVDRRLLAAAAAATAVFNSPALPLSPPIYHPRVIRRRQLRN